MKLRLIRIRRRIPFVITVGLLICSFQARAEALDKSRDNFFGTYTSQVEVCSGPKDKKGTKCEGIMDNIIRIAPEKNGAVSATFDLILPEGDSCIYAGEGDWDHDTLVLAENKCNEKNPCTVRLHFWGAKIITDTKGDCSCFCGARELLGSGNFTKKTDGALTESAPKKLPPSKNEKAAIKERLVKEQAEKEQAERERLDKERLAKERADIERADKERIAKEIAERERADKERIAKERAARERANKERLAREREDREHRAKLLENNMLRPAGEVPGQPSHNPRAVKKAAEPEDSLLLMDHDDMPQPVQKHAKHGLLEELREANTRLTRAYKQLANSLDKESRLILRDEQRAWLKERDAKCDSAYSGTTMESWLLNAAAQERRAQCVLKEMKTRTSELSRKKY